MNIELSHALSFIVN